MEYLSIPKKEFPVAHGAFAEPIMTKESFLRLADDFRSPHLWTKESGEWKLRHVIWDQKAS